ncbi:hypothetical protein QZQ24_16110 [Serratia marcescens]|uniref:hypothetical protein n=1 Tax=Serratia marcescens TaxID=615 RepID=UPI0027694DBA|nr:hypothetical protein [Serratia marcescens]MDP8834518.1 hypothetical protein [Serratia marcescens]
MSEQSNKVQSQQDSKVDKKKGKTAEAPVIAPALTGHYQSLIQPGAAPQPDAAAPVLTGGDTLVTLSVSGSQLDTEHLNQDQATLSAVLALEVAEMPTGVEVLLVQAVSLNGFYRAGQFWPHEGVHAFVCDDPDSDNAESTANMVAPFISAATAERLKAEPNLRVTVVETVVTDAEGE